MARRLPRPGGRRGWIRPGGLRRRLVVAFVLVAAVSAGALAVARPTSSGAPTRC